MCCWSAENWPVCVTLYLKGMPCCAQFSVDDLWYRAQIKKLKGGKRAEVYFVDLGYKEVLPLCRIRPIEHDLLKQSAQAIHCSLKDIVAPSVWPANILRHFEGMTIGKELVLKAEGYDMTSGKYSVLLLDTSHGQMDSIAAEMTRMLNFNACVDILDLAVAPGTSESVFVTYVTSFRKFFCQVTRSHPELDNLMWQMQSHYTTLDTDQEQDPTAVKPRVMMSARYGSSFWRCISIVAGHGSAWFHLSIICYDNNCARITNGLTAGLIKSRLLLGIDGRCVFLDMLILTVMGLFPDNCNNCISCLATCLLEPGLKPSQSLHSQEWSISNFPCSLNINITSHSKENLAFYRLLKRKVIILPFLTATLIRVSLEKDGRMYFLNLGVKGFSIEHRNC